MQRIRTQLAAAMVVAGAATSMALPACAAAARTAHAAHTAHASALPSITVTMTGHSIAVRGQLQSGGVNILSRVSGEQFGDATFVRLDPDVSVADFFSMLAHAGPNPDPNGLNGFASIVVDAPAARGTSSVQASLAPGQYVALDTSANSPAQWPHTSFVISPAASPAPLPTPQATLAAIEFGFRGPGVLHDCELLRVANNGYLVHMVFYIQARDAAAAVRLAALLRQGKDNEVQQQSIGFGGFAGPLSHGAYQQLIVHNPPGWYVIACFMDTQDGREHTTLGMERVIQIVR